MSAYTSAPWDWCRRAGGIGYVVRHPLNWEVGRKGSGLWFMVPPGFGFDVSVPRLLRWAVDPHEPRLLKAAALHDKALEAGWRRTSAAGLFEDALHADGVGRWARLRMTLAVICWRWA